jgi:hypothetical protein
MNRNSDVHDATTPSMLDARFRHARTRRQSLRVYLRAAQPLSMSACTCCTCTPDTTRRSQHRRAAQQRQTSLVRQAPECACTSVVCRERPSPVPSPAPVPSVHLARASSACLRAHDSSSLQTDSCPFWRARESAVEPFFVFASLRAPAYCASTYGHECQHAAQMLERVRGRQWGEQ